ncbi:MAG: hypothetical protein EBU90_24240 [Proteobacteria bacterium]|nr:hypothetical protein [Pseudomonadota bacterium]NBP16273.1 hypothetical protein [bacterium]
MINFKTFLEDDIPVITDEEIDELVEALEWDDVIDFYDDDELFIDEAISATSRLRKASKFRSMKGKVVQARQMKLRRASDTKTINKRAKAAARRSVYNKLLKGRNKSTLSAAEKDRLESLVSRILSIQGNVTTKFIPKVKDIERKRLSGAKKK